MSDSGGMRRNDRNDGACRTAFNADRLRIFSVADLFIILLTTSKKIL
jgi:hypothetical protein